jgi:hypothetical protein|tara:strand:- start:12 stop:260 length:249 start_codon:yes stop_codon:yes gene_type:complete
MKTKHLTFDWEISPNNIVEIQYTYTQEDGDRFQPAYEEICIDKMSMNGDDVTDRFENYIEEITDEIINEGDYNIDFSIKGWL